MKKKLAFEHKDMLKKAINMLEAYPKLHKKIYEGQWNGIY